MVLPTAAVGFLVAWIAGAEHQYFPAMITGFLLIPIDLFFRYRNSDPNLTNSRRWFAIDSGGWLAFPVWCLGVGFIVIYFLPTEYLESL